MPDKRLERSCKSVINLQDHLRKVCKESGAFSDDKSLIEALKSQNKLAKYENNKLGIVATSLNTIKRVSAIEIDGGFNALDDLRKGALERIEAFEQRGNKSNKRTRAGLALRVNELEDDVQKFEKVIYVLMQALTEVVKDIKSVANIEDVDTRYLRSKEARKKLMSIMAINAPPFDCISLDSNVIPLTNKK